ncbi:MAG TPA: serine/threonine-protein kinase [Polyangiaceae bacterium]|nr:serine/threonine-protein kinase [Polyangiaceae bacterium]
MTRDPLVRFDSIGAEVRIDVHVDVGEPRGLHAEAPPPSSGTSSPLERPLHSGHVVGGRYELVRLLGRGSMGAVWLANHTTLGERVALKLMTTTEESSSVEDARTSAARFRFEAQIAARLSRKTRHVVRVTDHGHDGAVPYLVMELLEGQTLEKALLCRGPLSVGEVSALVSQIARGLEAAHAEGVLHRDLKPANVFLADSGEGRPVVKLLDFGVARRRPGQQFAAPFATAKGLIVGTPGYMSPEQAAATEIDVRSDLWSLAAIAYEALTGELPVIGVDADHMLSNLRACRTVPLRERRPDLPTSLDRFFQQAFAPRIEDRYGTCAELAEAFEVAARAGAGPGGTRRLLPPPHAVANADARRPDASSGKKKYTRYAVGAFLVAAGLTGLCYSSARSRESKPSARAPSTPAADPVVARESAGASLSQPGSASMQMRIAPSSAASPLATQGAVADPPPLAPKAAPRWAPGELGEFKAYY